MYKRLQPVLQKELESIREAGLFKKERIITTPQGGRHKNTGWQSGDKFLCQQLFRIVLTSAGY
jgi:hypothetical protein